MSFQLKFRFLDLDAVKWIYAKKLKGKGNRSAHGLSATERKSLQAIFNSLDCDGSGSLDMEELQDNFQYLRSIAKAEKRDNIALYLMESLIDAMKERELSEVSFYEFQDILINLLVHKKKFFDSHLNLNVQCSESPLAPLKEMVAFHRKYTLNQISKKGGDDDVDTFMAFKSLFNIHTSMHEFDKRNTNSVETIISNDFTIPPKHALIIGLASFPSDDNEVQIASSGMYMNKPFAMMQLRSILLTMGLKNDDSIKIKILVVGTYTNSMRKLCTVVKEEETARNDVVFAKAGMETVEMLATRDFDFILVDKDMPIMCGTEVIKAIADSDLHLLSKSKSDHAQTFSNSTLIIKSPSQRILEGGTSSSPTFLPRLGSVKNDLKVKRSASMEAMGTLSKTPFLYLEKISVPEIKLLSPLSNIHFKQRERNRKFEGLKSLSFSEFDQDSSYSSKKY